MFHTVVAGYIDQRAPHVAHRQPVPYHGYSPGPHDQRARTDRHGPPGPHPENHLRPPPPPASIKVRSHNFTYSMGSSTLFTVILCQKSLLCWKSILYKDSNTGKVLLVCVC